MLRRLVSSVVIASTAVLVSAAPALAHIDPDPKQAQAGSRLTVGFTVEHGCEGSPTTQLDMRMPVGASDPVAEDVDGWDGSVETVGGDTIVTFVGGPLADDVEGTFAVTMTLPATPDATIHFPFVQRCEVGEIRWIGIPSEPGEELDEPAPAMNLIGPVATVPPPTAPPTTVSDSTVPGSTEPNTTEPEATTPPATIAPDTTPVPSDTTEVPATSVLETSSDSSGPNIGTIAFIITMAVVFGLGAFVAFRARQARTANQS